MGQAKQIIDPEHCHRHHPDDRSGSEGVWMLSKNLESLRLMLLQLHRREGWKALGIPAGVNVPKGIWAITGLCLQTHAAEVEENLAATGIING